MRFSLQAEYAICGAFDIAYNGHGEAVQVRVIGERQGIPTRYLEQIFQRLRRAGLVTAKRGPGGGYRLARDAREISLRALVEAVEGPLRPFEALRAGTDAAAQQQGVASARRAGGAGPDFLWPQLTRAIGAQLEAVSVADLCREAAQSGVERAELVGYEYQI